VFVRIKSPTLKHLFNVSITVFNLLFMLNMFSAFLQLLLDVVVTYLLARGMKDSRMPWIVFIFVMGHLMINHVIRALFSLSYETMEVTGPQMVLVMKLTTFAWNVYDGRRPAKDLDKWQEARKVTDAKFPSFLAFLGYSFYFPGFLVGPFLEYAEYDALISEKLFSSIPPPENLEEKLKKRAVPPGRKRVAYFKMLSGLFYLGLYVVLLPKFNFNETVAPWFLTKNIWERIAYFQVAGFFERSKYYAVWTLTEGAAILTGLGFTGYSPNGKTLWDGAANVKVLQIEFPENFKMLLDSWNMKTNVWLRECVYKRVTKKGAKPGFASSMSTFAVSAFWHGIAPGYYLTFLFGGFVTTVARLARSTIRPLLIPVPGTYIPASPTLAKRAYDLAGIAVSILLCNYAAGPFMLGTIEKSFESFSRMAWYGYGIVGFGMVFFYGGGSRMLKKAQAKRVKRAEITKQAAEAFQSGASGTQTPNGPHVVAPVHVMAEEVMKELEKAQR